MKKLLICLFVIGSFTAKPCGWGPEDDNYFYYNLFHQTNISSEGYYPFLYDEMNAFFDGNDGNDPLFGLDKANLKLWQSLLKDWSLEQINTALKTADQAEFEKVWKGKNHPQAKEYMAFARKCSNAFAARTANTWDYDRIRENGNFEPEPLLKEGNTLLQSCKNSQLKLRYAYQVIRTLHYSKQYEGAIKFFENFVANTADKNEIYYYVLDHVAGCYYSMRDYEKAAYLFLQVFSESEDRKQSAFSSYRFCTNQGSEGKKHFNGAKDRESFVLMRSLRSFSTGLEGLNELYSMNPESDKVELLFMRALNAIERKLLPKHEGRTLVNLPNSNPKHLNQLEQLLSFAQGAQQNKAIQNQAFWQLTESYILFLKGDPESANEKLSAIESEQYHQQIETLGYVYDVFSWKKIEEHEENYLAEKLKGASPIGEFKFNWKDLILEQVGHLYYTSGDIAKAFLVHNQLEVVEQAGSIRLIDALKDFVNKSSKSSFEKMLMERAGGIKNDSQANTYLSVVKGNYYLQWGNLEAARKHINELYTSDLSTFNTDLDANISAKVFSNNTLECFNCDESSMMTDEVYKANIFSFIKSEFNRADLVENLASLKDMTQSGTLSESKLANYLLGNFYYNASNTGYHRGVLEGNSSNCCHYNYVPYSGSTDEGDNAIDKQNGYNLYNISGSRKVHGNLAELATEYYEQVIENSDDEELNARTTFMLAKCELNAYYNSGKLQSWDQYAGNLENSAGNYKKNFDALQSKYKNTQFYQQIIRECSFFSIYTSM